MTQAHRIEERKRVRVLVGVLAASLMLSTLVYLFLLPRDTPKPTPPQFTQEEIAEQVADAFRLYIESSGGQFPDVAQFHGDALMHQLEGDLQLPHFAADSVRWGFSHLTTLQRNDRTFRYFGAGRVEGNGDAVIAHWSTTQGRHQVVFDDLTHRVIDDAELASLTSPWIDLARNCVVRVEHGSGTVVSANGLILTANHVLGSKGGAVNVTFADDTAATAVIVQRNQRLDIALLRLNVRPNMPGMPIASATPAAPDSLWMIGYPSGRVSPLIREARTTRTILHELIVASQGVAGGDSGGAVVNDHGELVGVIIGPASAGLVQIRATDARAILDAFPTLR